MSDERMNTYEGLFLFPQSASADLQGSMDHVQELLDRSGAEVLSFRKWEERRLAYEIKGNKRGVYFLTYFKAPAGKLAGLERDCNLSEHLLRSMITRADHIRPEIIEAAEGRSELADEIRLRESQAAEAETQGAAATVRKPAAAAPASEPVPAGASTPSAPAEGTREPASGAESGD